MAASSAVSLFSSPLPCMRSASTRSCFSSVMARKSVTARPLRHSQLSSRSLETMAPGSRSFRTLRSTVVRCGFFGFGRVSGSVPALVGGESDTRQLRHVQDSRSSVFHDIS